MSSYFSSFFSSLVSSGGVQAAEKPPAARPSHHRPDGKGFRNPWPSAGDPHGFLTFFSLVFSGEYDFKRGSPPPESDRVPVIPMDWEGILHFHDDHDHEASAQQEASQARVQAQAQAQAQAEDAEKKKVRATWLGHAAFLVQMEGCNILTDPCCSERCSPLSFAGPKRIRPLPCELRELAPLTDAVIISHNHYDHLDLETIRTLGPEVTYFVPLGNKAWFTDNFPNYSKVVECDWWDSVTLHKSRSSPSPSSSSSSSSSSTQQQHSKATWTSSKRNLLLEENVDADAGDVGSQGDHDSLEFVCTPCQHFSGRSLTDRMQTLWASWAIRSTTPTSPGSTSRTSSFFFGGDTGYRAVPRGLVTTTTTVTTPTTITTTTTTTAVVIEDAEAREHLPHCPAFKEIGDRLGPFDLSCLPIGAYSPRWFMSQVHCDPLDAVHIHRDIRSKKSIGMHWGTFLLTDEDPREPPLRLKEALRIVGRDPQEFVTLKIGESLEV